MLTGQAAQQQLAQRKQLMQKSAAYWALFAIGLIGLGYTTYRVIPCFTLFEDHSWDVFNDMNTTVTSLYTNTKPPRAWGEFESLLAQVNLTLVAVNHTAIKPLTNKLGSLPITYCASATLTTTSHHGEPLFDMLRNTVLQAGGLPAGGIQPAKILLLFGTLALAGISMSSFYKARKHYKQARTIGTQAVFMGITEPHNPLLLTLPSVNLHAVDTHAAEDTVQYRIAIEEARARMIESDQAQQPALV
ncbi:MAG: hypothetical protein P1U34_00330 [Coxiellaceae bacterium]|nr:hypothetical protein [Coxiellaceae bacterium]